MDTTRTAIRRKSAWGAGTPRRFDHFLDITLAYKVAFGWIPEWGSPGDLRDDLNFMSDVLPHVATPGPGNFGLWEFIRLVNRLPNDSYYVNPVGLPERGQNLYFAFAVSRRRRTSQASTRW